MGEDSGQASGEEGLSDEEIAKLQQREDELIQANLDAQANKAKNKGNGHGGSQGRKKRHHRLDFQPQGSIQQFSVPVEPKAIVCRTRQARAIG
jgi:hypothetical protein